jgi:hypothetical protein
MTFYAYLHAKPTTVDASGIFYVGKGNGKRAYEIARSNKHHSNIVAKYGKEGILVSKIDCSSEDIAFELEKGLIKCLRRMGVNLANRTEGGEGISGHKHTDEAKLAIRAARLKDVSTSEGLDHMRQIAKIKSEELVSEVSSMFKSLWSDPDYKRRVSLSQSLAQKGKPITEVKFKSVISNAEKARDRLNDPEIKAESARKNSEKSKAMWATPGFREMMAERRAIKKQLKSN